jgi:glycosyltransferase involved in cell wall biosynthesis
VEKKISIIIPSFNRADYLYRAAKSIAKQITDDIPMAVELSIFDNASEDETVDVCNQLLSEFSNICIVRNVTNVGAEANITNAFKSANGDFVWIFGDDDYLVDGALQIICSLLLEDNPDILKIALVEERGEKKKQVFIDRKLAPDRGWIVSPYSNANQVLVDFGLGIGNYSTAIFSVEFYRDNYVIPADDIFQSCYSQLDWIYRGLIRQACRFIYLSAVCVCVRIEINPRDLDSSKIKHGLRLILDRLDSYGYDHSLLSQLYQSQVDAMYVGYVKTCKYFSLPIDFSLMRGNQHEVSPRAIVKALIIFMLPKKLYQFIWERI